jgi:hypothetical protein
MEEGEGAPEAGVMPARPAITPLRRATVEGLFFAHEMNSHTIPDEQAAICIVRRALYGVRGSITADRVGRC